MGLQAAARVSQDSSAIAFVWNAPGSFGIYRIDDLNEFHRS
jgi:hypothetical protein